MDTLHAQPSAPAVPRRGARPMMRAAVFVEKDRIVLDDKPIPEVGPRDALIRITTATICGVLKVAITP